MARATVASDMPVQFKELSYSDLSSKGREISPVLPTVPSKILEPVFGTNSPALSASSMTVAPKSEYRRIFSTLRAYKLCVLACHTLCKATRSFTEPPGLRNYIFRLSAVISSHELHCTYFCFPLFLRTSFVVVVDECEQKANKQAYAK